MPDRYSFTSPFSSNSEPWFKLFGYDITTTLAVVLLSISSMVWWTIEGAPWQFLYGLAFDPTAITNGQVWRIFTWPFVTVPNLWVILSLVFFYIFGSQVEQGMGKKPFLILIGSLILIPASLATLAALGTPSGMQLSIGIQPLYIGVLVAYAARNPQAPFFFSIPAWVIAAVFVGIDLMSSIGQRFMTGIIFTVSATLLTLILTRSFGYASETLSRIPAIPLGSLGGSQQPVRAKKKKKKNLHVVPTPQEEDEINSILEKISDTGMKSLSKEQKRKLEKYSKNMRKKNQ